MDSTSVSLLRRLREPKPDAAWQRFVDLYAPLIYHWDRKSLPLETLNGTPVAEFWKQFAARRKAAEEFAESTPKLPAEKQVEAVRARLADFTPLRRSRPRFAPSRTDGR